MRSHNTVLMLNSLPAHDHWSHVCDRFKLMPQACTHMNDLLKRIPLQENLKLICMDMNSLPKDQLHMKKCVQVIQHMCEVTLGTQVPICVWCTQNHNKAEFMQVLGCHIQGIWCVDLPLEYADVMSSYDLLLQGHKYWHPHVQHVIRYDWKVQSHQVLMLADHVNMNMWCMHHELLSKELPVMVHSMCTWADLLHAIMQQAHKVHDVIVHSESLRSSAHGGVWEMLNCLRYVHASCKPDSAPMLRIHVMVPHAPDLCHVRNIMSCALVHGLMPEPDAHTTYEQIRAAMVDQMQHKYHVPTHLQQLLDKNKVKFCKRKTKSQLTPREQQITDLICDNGLSNKQIALQLQITESTVKLHLGNILKKLQVRNRTQLVLKIKPTTVV